MFDKKNIKNILANLTGKFWAIFANLAVVPIYLQFIDLNDYGLIALYTTIILTVNIADAGLSPSFARDMARANHISEMGNALKTLELAYFMILMIISAIACLLSDSAVNLLNFSDSYSSENNRLMFTIMVISACFQLCTVVYRAGFMGMEKHVKANVFTIIYSVLRLIVPIGIFCITTDLVIFFAYQMFLSILYLVLIRLSFWQEVGNRKEYNFDLSYLLEIKRFAGGLFVVSIISTITMQLDKFMISHFIGMESLSVYSISSSVALLLYSVCLPIVTTFYPRITKLCENNKHQEMRKIYTYLNILISFVSISLLLTLYYYSYQVIFLWTQDIKLAKETSKIIPIMSAGAFFLCMQLLPYHLGLANGYNKANVILGFVFIFLTPMVLYYSIPLYGVLAPAYNWLFVNLIYFLALTLVIGLKFEGVRLFFIKTVSSIVIITIMIFSFEMTNYMFDFNWMLKVIISTLIGLFFIFIIYIIGSKYAFIYRYSN
ncbi:polysaccharide biosynthesis protein [Vibrio cholerae]|nr:oligosaccharide flippase family protein [Vibrio cholerae]BCN18350.1 putative O-antigen flippase [Vibrio cholerae]GHX41076.1 polysaccharide biosynthesis protein [Vibrio cholerae]